MKLSLLISFIIALSSFSVTASEYPVQCVSDDGKLVAKLNLPEKKAILIVNGRTLEGFKVSYEENRTIEFFNGQWEISFDYALKGATRGIGYVNVATFTSNEAFWCR